MTTIISHLYDKFLFGKFRGETLGDVLMYAPSYLTWVVKNVDGNHFLLMDSAVEEIKVIFPDYIMDDDFDMYRQKQLDDYANQHNPNNKAYHARMNNDQVTKKQSKKSLNHEANKMAKRQAEFEDKNGVLYPLDWMCYSNPYDFD